MHKTLLFILLALTANCFGQLSQGGYPLDVISLKSVSLQKKVMKMPSFDLKAEENEDKLRDNLKSLKFAHSFPVSISPQNHGTWYDIDDYRVWKLTIQSEGAYSLNIFFSKFFIPEGARLFVFDKQKNVILGAFTSKNNKPYKKLAIYPLPGDELIVQYEEPNISQFPGELEIGEVNHDYKGIFTMNNRFPRRPSEDCNIDVNCESGSGLENEKRAVCRVIARGELGVGTLVNNTQQNGKPYLISAFHVYDKENSVAISDIAEETIYDFNYESPFCTGLNGYDNQSLSGSTALASYDSLDMILVELDEVPPPIYRPYFAGWDATHKKPFNCYTIHHPNGDVKKITHDTGTCDSASYLGKFIGNCHWKVLNWESGATEPGSSGAGLFNNEKHMVGTLSGGNASCSENSYDMFARFDKLWNYSADTLMQLKKWLDPDNTGTIKIDGYDPYESTSNECNMFSNFMLEDVPAVLPENSGKLGIYTGNNSMNITEIAEKISGYDRAVINGIAIGISHLVAISDKPEITVRIYTGDTIPKFAVKQFKFPMKNLTSDAMNFLSFPEPVEVGGNFFISIVIPEEDSLSIYQSPFRTVGLKGSMIVKLHDVWKQINRLKAEPNGGASLLIQVMVCDASFPQTVDTTLKDSQVFKAFPNPASDYLIVEFKRSVPSYEYSIFDMAGRMLLSDCFQNRMYGEIDVSGLLPGIYLIRVNDGELSEVKRIVIN